jgi:hypothetical protein
MNARNYYIQNGNKEDFMSRTTYLIDTIPKDEEQLVAMIKEFELINGLFSIENVKDALKDLNQFEVIHYQKL